MRKCRRCHRALSPAALVGTKRPCVRTSTPLARQAAARSSPLQLFLQEARVRMGGAGSFRKALLDLRLELVPRDDLARH
eukprot:CAMPEP_0182531924 /NCGR_PEP_ID=MMETSP1323-20130603/10233_1 /TAXON_ID=236787 /ORGANISM="Florenciella parvula, Strain RCC1693" /LENGTH=78 /DNA_ID=CAMNT_0024741573 /DNA_START=43 /DNA_END=279 /DNA_ORIENTATION=+